eukprot:CAMPEP_0194052122 /NCGR_PEP_ID=MMETSP0009_2-20130614/44061_1 /TAXON_ID=210454 /ORGANISM="Grammatophora oceanica, Strain CCMP 410" /LENGTH=132 /DNA_ID=CAMNT_0038699555 /DNA_START=165 /DNA_END=560 /DNA_ORIENTATION=+
METAFAAHNYFGGSGQIVTPANSQNVTSDCILAAGPAAFPVLAEVGQSQSIDALNTRAKLLLTSVPGARVVILVKIFDDTTAENGRMVAWCATLDMWGNTVLSRNVELGRTGPGGVARIAWVAGVQAPPVLP